MYSTLKHHLSSHKFATLLLLFGLLAGAFSAHAANQAIATVSSNKVVQGEVFQLSIVSDKRLDSNAIDFSALDKDFYLGQVSFGTSMSSINGKSSIRSEWLLPVAVQKVGTFVIPSFKVGDATTQPITITATADSSLPDTSDLLQTELTLSKTKLYPDEKALLTARLIVKADTRYLKDVETTSPFASQGVTIEPLADAEQKTVVINGVKATVVEQQFRVSANQAGQYQLTGFGIKTNLIVRRNYNSRIVPLESQPKSLALEVKPKPLSSQDNWLPSADLSLTQTWQLNGEMVSSVQPLQLETGDSLTRTLTLSASDLSAEQIPSLPINYPSSVRVYKEKPQITENTQGETTLIIKHVILPKQAGEILLPGSQLHWWNTQTDQAELATAQSLNLVVTAAETSEQGFLAPSSMTAKPQQATETITVTDSGYWPALTALFSTLWLITLAFAWRMHVKGKQQQAVVPQTKSLQYTDFLNSLKGTNGWQIQSAYNRWKQAHPDIPSELKAQIETELDKLYQTLYSSKTHSKPWDHSKLTALVRKAEAFTSSATSQLPQL